MDSKKDIKSLNLEELKTELESMGEKAFRAKQMYEWMHVKLARSFDEMTNLSAKFREQCKEKYEYRSEEHTSELQSLFTISYAVS